MATKRILVIDDEPDIRAVVQACLEELGGWEVRTASSGREGLAKVVAEPPDAIVLDLMMPVMDGLSFLTALRHYLPQFPIPVVLLTAKINLTQNPKFYELGVEGIVAKPFEPLDLPTQLARLLGWEQET